MDDDKKSRRTSFAIIFWAVVIVGVLVYVSYVLAPRAIELNKHESELKAARINVKNLTDELARKKAVINSLKGENPSPDVIERVLRSRNYAKPDEVRIPLTDNQ
jgi:cell division protein FtsB